MNIKPEDEIFKNKSSTKNEMIDKDIINIINLMETKNKRNKLTIKFLEKLLEESNEYLYKIIKNFDNINI